MTKGKKKQQFWERSKTKGFNNLLGYADKGNYQGKNIITRPIRLGVNRDDC